MAEEFNRVTLHDDFEGLWNFVHELCKKEAKLIFLHASDEPAPACEMSHKRAKFAAWEDPAIGVESMPFGIPGRDIHGEPTDQFNWCPYCNFLVWTSKSAPIGAKLECFGCKAQFRRNLE